MYTKLQQLITNYNPDVFNHLYIIYKRRPVFRMFFAINDQYE